MSKIGWRDSLGGRASILGNLISMMGKIARFGFSATLSLIRGRGGFISYFILNHEVIIFTSNRRIRLIDVSTSLSSNLENT